MFDWRRPTNLGVRDKRLAQCRRTPNCVLSQADPRDREHYIDAIAFSGSMDQLREIVQAMPGATVIRVEKDYLYAECRTRVMRFVDDFELFLDGGTLHVRSASRL